MKTQLKDFATSVVAVVEPKTPALVVAQLMSKHHVGALVVVDAPQKTRLDKTRTFVQLFTLLNFAQCVLTYRA
jgi:hypothetical protein